MTETVKMYNVEDTAEEILDAVYEMFRAWEALTPEQRAFCTKGRGSLVTDVLDGYIYNREHWMYKDCTETTNIIQTLRTVGHQLRAFKEDRLGLRD